MLKALYYIFLFLILGEFINYFLGIPIAGNILGMILIFIALKLKLIKLENVKPASRKLVQYMVLFFVPYGVGLMVYFEVILTYWIPILTAIVVSTLITLYITAIIQQKLEKDE